MKVNELTIMRKPLAQGALAKKPIEFPGNKQMDSSVGELGGKIGAILNSQ